MSCIFEDIFHNLNAINVLLLVVVVSILLAYVFWDVNYFLRIAFTIGYAKIFLPRRKPTDIATLYGFCTTQDVDIFFRHMNNARYIRELDFARFQYYERSGLYSAIVNAKGTALQGASTIRYRKTIPIFTIYKIVTKLIYWDEKALYLEQQFISVSDQFVRAIALSKQNIVGINVNEMLKNLLGSEYKEPERPKELDHWIQSIEISSAKLRKSD